MTYPQHGCGSDDGLHNVGVAGDLDGAGKGQAALDVFGRGRHQALRLEKLHLVVKGDDVEVVPGLERFDAQLDSVPRHLATKIAKSQRDIIQGMLNKAETLAQVQHEKLVEEASRRFALDLDEEANRLQALREVNPLVRPDEITTLSRHKDEGLTHLRQAKIRLDAIRVLVVG